MNFTKNNIGMSLCDCKIDLFEIESCLDVNFGNDIFYISFCVTEV